MSRSSDARKTTRWAGRRSSARERRNLAIAHSVDTKREAMENFVGSLSDETREVLIELLDLGIIFGAAEIAFELLKGAVSLMFGE
jgi:hypothetical protein